MFLSAMFFEQSTQERLCYYLRYYLRCYHQC